MFQAATGIDQTSRARAVGWWVGEVLPRLGQSNWSHIAPPAQLEWWDTWFQDVSFVSTEFEGNWMNLTSKSVPTSNKVCPNAFNFLGVDMLLLQVHVINMTNMTPQYQNLRFLLVVWLKDSKILYIPIFFNILSCPNFFFFEPGAQWQKSQHFGDSWHKQILGFKVKRDCSLGLPRGKNGHWLWLYHGFIVTFSKSDHDNGVTESLTLSTISGHLGSCPTKFGFSTLSRHLGPSSSDGEWSTGILHKLQKIIFQWQPFQGPFSPVLYHPG